MILTEAWLQLSVFVMGGKDVMVFFPMQKSEISSIKDVLKVRLLFFFNYRNMANSLFLPLSSPPPPSQGFPSAS